MNQLEKIPYTAKAHTTSGREGGASRASDGIAWQVAASAPAQTAREVRGAAAVVRLQNEPPAKIIIDPPLDQRSEFSL